MNGSTSGSSFWTLANFFRSSCEKLAHGTRSYLPSPTLICTPASFAEPVSSFAGDRLAVGELEGVRVSRPGQQPAKQQSGD